MNFLKILKKELWNFLEKNFSLSESELTKISFELNADEKKQQFGDISTNAALLIAKKIKDNPREIANKIIKKLSHELIEKLEIAGPGFINIFLTEKAFTKSTKKLFENHNNFFKLDKEEKKINYSVEFVSANPTGPLHIGHGRGGIIGDVLGNILKFIGHATTKEFYINDAGTQIRKLGNSFKIRCRQELKEKVELPEDAYHGEYLKNLAKELVEKSNESVENALKKNDEEFFTNYAKDKLLDAIKKTVLQYSIKFDVWASEKSLHTDGTLEKTLEMLQKKNFSYTSEGALWFKATEFGDEKDRVLKKSNGEFTYAASDLAYILSKIEQGHEKLVVVLGQDHHGYVSRLKGFMEALGYNPNDLQVILYQLVTLKEGSEILRMSKRKGHIVSLRDLIEMVGVDVARFFYLNRKAEAHLVFDLDLALKRTEENPVYYVQYAYVRINSILEKVNENCELGNISMSDLSSLDENEKLLIKKIISLKELLSNISKNFHTHLLSYYILDLANAFHSYYASHKVIDTGNIKQSRHRLLLMKLLHNTFKLCMELLGISRPAKM